MTSAPTGLHSPRAGLELLERALTYTRLALTGVSDDLLDRPTPCAGWHLAVLLAHMEDSLDAFTEAVGGRMGLRMAVPARVRVESLQVKACHLLGAWTAAEQRDGPGTVLVGGLPLDVGLVAHAAALEIAVHGWDVDRAVGGDRRLPPGLAQRLLVVADDLVSEADRGIRFAVPVGVSPHARPEERLLARLGRVA